MAVFLKDAQPTAPPGNWVVPLASVGLLWSVLQFFEDLAWEFPLLRGALLLGVAVVAALLAVRPPTALTFAGDTSDRRAVWCCLVIAALTGAIICPLSFLYGARSSKFSILLIFVVCLAPLFLPVVGTLGQRLLRLLARHATGIMIFVCLIALTTHIAGFALHLFYTGLVDIGQTTLDALNAVLEGHNPYALPIDAAVPDPAYKGYKYLPAMMAIYTPLGAVWVAPGLRATNLVLDMATAALVASLATRVSGRLAGLMAATIYLLMPIAARELYLVGVTDLAAVVPMLAALLLLDKRPEWAGFAAGLALSVKLFPGLLVIVCCIPATRRPGYAAGVIAGLVPAILFFSISPTDFSNNILLFNLVRPPDTTSVAAALPWIGGLVLKLLSAFILFSIIVLGLFTPVDLRRRCAFIVVGVIAALVSGPVLHNNYMMWWLPAFCVLLAGPLAAQISLSQR